MNMHEMQKHLFEVLGIEIKNCVELNLVMKPDSTRATATYYVIGDDGEPVLEYREIKEKKKEYLMVELRSGMSQEEFKKK